MHFNELTSAIIISSIIIWSRWFQISLDRFIEFVTNSFEIASSNMDHSIPHHYDIHSPLIELDQEINSIINRIQLYVTNSYTTNIIYFFLFIGLIIFSSPLKSIRKIRTEHFKSYNYITYIIYSWIFISILSHFPLLHDLMEIQLSLFPYFLFITLAIVNIFNITIKFIFKSLFVYQIGPRRRFYEILHSSAFISILCSMLYGECEYYKYHNSNVCKFLLININSVQYKAELGIMLTPVMRVWLTGIAIICINYIIEGIVVNRIIFSSMIQPKKIEPQNTHEMVTWFSMSHHGTLLDVIMQLGIFVNRFDRRMLNAAFLNSCKPRSKKSIQNGSMDMDMDDNSMRAQMRARANSMPNLQLQLDSSKSHDHQFLDRLRNGYGLPNSPKRVYRHEFDGNFQTQDYEEMGLSPSSFEYNKYNENMADISINNNHPHHVSLISNITMNYGSIWRPIVVTVCCILHISYKCIVSVFLFLC